MPVPESIRAADAPRKTPRRVDLNVVTATLIAHQLRAEDMADAAAVVDRIAAAMDPTP